MTTCGNKNACGEKECTSNLGLSSKMGWMAEGFSFCLDSQEINIKKKKKRRVRCISIHMELDVGRPHE